MAVSQRQAVILRKYRHVRINCTLMCKFLEETKFCYFYGELLVPSKFCRKKKKILTLESSHHLQGLGNFNEFSNYDKKISFI